MYKHLVLFGITLAVVVGAIAYAPRESAAPAAAVATAQATLVVGEAAYPLSALAGETVLDAMRALASSSAFAFTGREYPGLGFFVESIGGKRNGDGKYWVFYVNGVSAAMGVSATRLQAGDLIEWKYETGY